MAVRVALIRHLAADLRAEIFEDRGDDVRKGMDGIRYHRSGIAQYSGREFENRQ